MDDVAAGLLGVLDVWRSTSGVTWQLAGRTPRRRRQRRAVASRGCGDHGRSPAGSRAGRARRLPRSSPAPPTASETGSAPTHGTDHRDRLPAHRPRHPRRTRTRHRHRHRHRPRRIDDLSVVAGQGSISPAVLLRPQRTPLRTHCPQRLRIPLATAVVRTAPRQPPQPVGPAGSETVSSRLSTVLI